MKILVIGASGLLGSYLLPTLKSNNYDVISLGRSGDNDYICDILDTDSIVKILDSLKPELILNLAALTDVDFCELNPNQAFQINAKALDNIVNWIEISGSACHLVQISTDHVYDGSGPHLESKPTLTNYYAFSKYASELSALRIPSTVIRTNFFGKSCCDNRESFTDWIVKSIKHNKNFSLFSDVFFSPLSMQTLSKMLSLVIKEKPIGIFNLGSKSGMSKSDFAVLFANKLNLNLNNAAIVSIDDISFMKTYRPKDMRMDVNKFEEYFDVRLPKLTDEIDKVLGDYYEKT